MTQCVAPPGPDDPALAAYNEGEADSATSDHMTRCPHCRARAQEQARLDQRLRARFYRIDCPTPDELQDYYFDLSPAPQMAAVTAHLGRPLGPCPHCTREVATLARFLSEDVADASAALNTSWEALAATGASTPSLRERIQTVIARWLQGGPASLTPALAGLRGADAGPALFAAGDVRISMELQPDPQQPDRHELLGAVMAGEMTDAWYTGWTAHLWQAGRLVAVAAADDLGSFVFARLAPAEYELILTAPGLIVQAAPVQVR
jgi:hypothetical protein